MRRYLLPALALLLVLSAAVPALAHFGMVIPSQATVSPDQRDVTLTLSFSHPSEMHGMTLEKPKVFKAKTPMGEEDLLGALKEIKVMDEKSWSTDYAVKRPGVYQFAMEPTPYWEPAEDSFIIHYTKTVIAAFGEEEGWDEPMGLATEIIPMLRPFGNFAGNAFVGKILLNGKPVPGGEVEVEYYNQDGALGHPSEYHVTQVIKADDNGVFVFACPLPGWWGFAALNTADYTLKDPEGKDKPVELGAVLWTKFEALK